MEGDRLAKAAEDLVGCRFRLRGRDPATGLDCVGVVAAALGKLGRSAAFPQNYALRNRDIDRAFALAPCCGLIEANGEQRAGDVILLEVGVCQYHVAICVKGGFVHAHAGLRKVVRSPERPDGKVLGHCRLQQS